MATRIGPRIPTVQITSGLILLWDAADRRSYTPGASIIYDLAGNYNGTVSAGCSYNNTSGLGAIVVDGPSAVISNSSINISNQNYTVMVSTRYTGGNRGRILTAINNNWLLGHWGGQAEKYYAEGWVSPAYYGPEDTAWRVFTGTGDLTADNWKFYVNSELRESNSNGSQGPNGISINTSGEYSAGQFSFLAIYNRILTEQEILINYNTVNRRYNFT